MSSVFIVLESESSVTPSSSDSTSKKQSSVDTAEAVVDKTELELIREAAELQLLQASSLRGDQDKVSQQNDTHCEAVPSVGAGQGSSRESESVSAAAGLLETLSSAQTKGGLF